MTKNAMLTDSSRVIRSAGSIGLPPPRAVVHSVCSGSGSGIHCPTYVSRRTRAEFSRFRQIRLVTVVSQAPGDSMASCSARGIAYQRAYVSCTASSASESEPSSR